MKQIANAFRYCSLVMIYLVALFMPFGFLMGPLAVLLFAGWLFSGDWKLKLENIKTAKFIWLWIAFFTWNLASYMWTGNEASGQFHIQVLLPVLGLPLVLASMRFDEKTTRRILAVFIFGLFASGLFMLSRSTWYLITEDRNTFYYQDFCYRVVHPSYLAMYFCAGIMLLFHGILLQSFSPKPWKVIAITLCLFFAVIIFLLSSKVGLIAMILLFGGYIIYSIIRFKRYVVGIAALLVMCIGFVVALKVFPKVGERIQNMTGMFSSQQPINPAEVESNRVRFLIWEAATAVVERHPVNGVGIGDAQDSLIGEYKSRGMTGAVEKNLNAHSQFFQTPVATGIPGLILLLLLFIAPIVYGLRRQFGFLVLTAALIFLNFLPESMLESQAGVIFMSFFYCLILFSIDRTVLLPMKAPPIKFPL
ncbi:MAG: O-antigen ligase family protein [Bacteroidota bacterium]|nr:O-antigen ligase family protein [Bacteroidota bacterium]